MSDSSFTQSEALLSSASVDGGCSVRSTCSTAQSADTRREFRLVRGIERGQVSSDPTLVWVSISVLLHCRASVRRLEDDGSGPRFNSLLDSCFGRVPSGTGLGRGLEGFGLWDMRPRFGVGGRIVML